MYSVISTLDPISTEAVKQLRSWLVERCSALSNVFVLEPHMSWLSAEKGNLPAIVDRLNEIAQQIVPLQLETVGYGIFPGVDPVLYLPVVTTRKLLNIHKILWKDLSAFIEKGNPKYEPDQWIPHITIFDVENKAVEDLSCAMRDLLPKDFHLRFTIDQFKLAYNQDDQYGYYSSHPFS